jgi:hypothetical protein
MDPATAFLVGKIKGELKARGGMGFHGLQRKFRIIDDDGSRTLSPSEFRKAMKEMNFTDITDREFQDVFIFFGRYIVCPLCYSECLFDKLLAIN